MRKYQNITEVKEANKAAGFNWFDKDTLRFFQTRIEGGIIRGQYFITSEQSLGKPRQFTLRLAHDNGKIDTMGNFCNTPTREQCKTLLALLPDYLPDALKVAKQARHDECKNDFAKHLLGSADLNTFTGACVWLVKNRKLLALGSWLTWFTDTEAAS